MGFGRLRAIVGHSPLWVWVFALSVAAVLPVQSALTNPTDHGSPKEAATTLAHHFPAIAAKLTFRVYNYAGLDSASLARSENVAGAILESAGIEASWMDCPLSKAEEDLPAYSACQSQMGRTDLVLKILPRRMAVKLHRRVEALGFGQPCPESESACELNVFYHRIDELAVLGYLADRILGHVIVHEMTHVLLGPGHSDDGIMRAAWTPSELQRISWGLSLDFTNDQSKRMRFVVLRRTILPVQQADLIAR